MISSLPKGERGGRDGGGEERKRRRRRTVSQLCNNLISKKLMQNIMKYDIFTKLVF